MRKTLFILAIVVALAGFAAAQVGIMTLSNTHATLSRVVFNGKKSYKTAILALNATSDKSGAVVTIYDKTATSTTCDALSAANAAVLNVTATTGFAQNDIICVQSPNGMDAAYIGVVTSVQAGVSLTCVANLARAVTAGEYVYKMGAIGTIPVGAATVSLSNETAIIAGEVYSPLMLTLDSTSAGSFNYATGYFVQ